MHLPHAWLQDVPVSWEGPAIYRARIKVPDEGCRLAFDRVSYYAEVYVDGEQLGTHEGLWDAFCFDLSRYRGREVDLLVRVTKNGGDRFPVTRTAAGFIPYVFHTFGGIYGPVDIVFGSEPVTEAYAVPEQRVAVEGSRLFVDGEPFYMRGVLDWGWYPESGHANPSNKECRDQTAKIASLGFNTVKFCLWVPSHDFLKEIEEAGLFAWIELPIWMPEDDPDLREKLFAEMERIVSQYRHHSCVIAWTAGCELSANAPAEWRKRLFDMIRDHTGCPLVRDSSGGAEMYGGDSREYATFYDYHPYCDLQFYRPVLESLNPGPRTVQPLLLGEFNDYDKWVHQDALHWQRTPYWAADDEYLNAKGVRWQYDLPKGKALLDAGAFAEKVAGEDLEHVLSRHSKSKSLFIRRHVNQMVVSMDWISGYVTTGHSDTPISSSGYFNHDCELNFVPDDLTDHNFDLVPFLIPKRRPPWVAGGNRPGWQDMYVHFAGDLSLDIGVFSQMRAEFSATLELQGSGVEPEEFRFTLEALERKQVFEARFEDVRPDGYELVLTISENGQGDLAAKWPIQVVERFDLDSANFELVIDWHALDLKALADGRNLVCNDPGPFQEQAPFWRECVQNFIGLEELAGKWHRLYGIAGDSVLDIDGLDKYLSVQAGGDLDRDESCAIHRWDTRTFRKDNYLAVYRHPGGGTAVFTTLRPQGGLGDQPGRLEDNPAGHDLLRMLNALCGPRR